MATEPVTTTPGRKRRLTLSLRALMVLVLVTGGGVGWVVNREGTRREAVGAVLKVKGKVFFDYQFHDDEFDPKGAPWEPAWLSRLVGVEFFHDVTMVQFPDRWKLGEAESRAALGALGTFDRLERLRLLNPPPGATVAGRPRLTHLDVTLGGPVHLARLPKLVEVRMSGPGVNDAVLPELAALPSLRDILLQNTTITDDGLARFGGPAGLEALWLDGQWVTDAGLPHLARFKALKVLSLSGNRGVTDAGLPALAKAVPGLTSLIVGRTGVTDAGLARLSDFPRLEGVHLDHDGADGTPSPITDAGMPHLAKLPNLDNLNLAGTGVTDRGLAALAGLRSLRWIALDRTAVTDAGLAHLAAMPTLRTVSLGTNTITDAGVARLAELPALETLTLSGPGVTDAGLKPLSGKATLKHLTLQGTKVTAAGVAALQATLKAGASVRTSPLPASVGPAAAARAAK